MAEPWRPRWVVEVELSALPSRLVVPSVSSDGGGAAGTRYRAARVLVRVQGEPIGVVNVALDADELPLAIVLAATEVQFGATLVARLGPDWRARLGTQLAPLSPELQALAAARFAVRTRAPDTHASRKAKPAASMTAITANHSSAASGVDAPPRMR